MSHPDLESYLQFQGIAIEMGELANRACDQRDTERELAQTWSAIACEHAIELGKKDVLITQLRRGLKEALEQISIESSMDVLIYQRLMRLTDQDIDDND